MEVEEAFQVVTARIGRFHVFVCSLITLAYVCQFFMNFTYIFTTMRAEHRCFIPECDSAGATDLYPPWLPLAVPASDTDPSRPDPCRRYEPLSAPPPGTAPCSAGAFSNASVRCDRRVYANKDLSVMTEWDMACSLAAEWQLSLVGTANSFGRALGLTLFGLVSDALGRKKALLAGLGSSCALGMARSFAPSYAAFIALEFLDPVFYDGIGGAAFIMGMELMPRTARGGWTALGHIMASLGCALLGLVAWQLPRWRLMLRVGYGSALFAVAALSFVPESVRWLMAKGRTTEAMAILERAAKMNRLPKGCFSADPAAPEKRVEVKRRSEAPQAPQEAVSSYSEEMRATLRSRILVLRLLLTCVCWIAMMFVYEGLSVYSVSLSGNPYLNFVLAALVELPASVIAWKMMAGVGRRVTLIAPVALACVCCAAFHFLPEKDPPWPRTSAVILAKLCVTVSFTATYILTAEIFPTKVRHTLYAIGSTCGRFGSALAPQVPLLSAVMYSLPMIVFAGTTFLIGLLALGFPETTDDQLPDTVAEAEAMGRPGRPGKPGGRRASTLSTTSTNSVETAGHM